MSVVFGNISLLMDLTSPKNMVQERKARPVGIDSMMSLPKRDPHALYGAMFDSHAESRNRVIARGKANSEMNGVYFNAESSDDDSNGDGYEEEGEQYNWESEMRMLKDIEERRELEKKANELQSRFDEGEGEKEKRMAVRKELEKVAKEQEQRRATAKQMFELGQKAYGRGKYRRAIEFFEGALTIIPRPTQFGGEIQIWLAMAYDANNRHLDCIALYKQLEAKHPSISIRRKAAQLLYISEAPKIKISQEEKFTIPSLTASYEKYASIWQYKYKNKSRTAATTDQLSSPGDDLWDYLVWRPPIGLEKNPSFWIALTLWLGLVAAAFLQR